ncbi:MAG: hypothetical protein JWM58_1801 [Rhizobium sp.]|nr:hypothetical protein [Rhizobium sp.]
MIRLFCFAVDDGEVMVFYNYMVTYDDKTEGAVNYSPDRVVVGWEEAKPVFRDAAEG